MREDIGKNERNCCDRLGGLFRQHRGIVATDREDSWEYRECIYYNNRRACCCKREGVMRHIGKFAETNREDSWEQQG